MVNGFCGVPDQSDDLGNLADELAEAWDEAEEEEEGSSRAQVDATQNGSIGLSGGFGGDSSNTDITTAELTASPSWRNPSNPPSSPTKRRNRPKHHRQFSSYGEPDYDGGSVAEDDEDSPLSARMAAIEILACQNLESNGGEPDLIIQRVANSLKELGSQSSLENSATK